MSVASCVAACVEGFQMSIVYTRTLKLCANVNLLRAIENTWRKNFAQVIKMSGGRTFGTSCDMSSSYRRDKLIYPAANRNKEHILKVLTGMLTSCFPKKESLLFLEISSGSGQHIAHFAPNFPHITFQPSEYEEDLLGSISIYAEECSTKNINNPKQIDITQDLSIYGFQPDSIDVIYNANMMHISPYECSIGLFKNCGKYLKPTGIMITYGPYGVDGVISPESNINFNQSLISQDSRWGIRDLNDLCELARENALFLESVVDMPANNKCLFWKKLEK